MNPMALVRNTQQRGFACVGLDNPKSSINVGAALRACGVYGADFMATTGQRYKKSASDTMAAYRHMPLLRVDNLHDIIPFDCVPVAVDLVEGATSIINYKHPERAFYIFGAEDATLGARITSWCRDVIYVPTSQCMNLAATVNVVLYDRMAKQARNSDLLRLSIGEAAE
jgi:tRNA(Leu) C34 or U34 (ribose-2'-O)-methylase TrmL